MKRLVCLLLLLGCPAYAADNVAGKWSGSVHASATDEQDHDTAAIIILQQNGSELTGTLTVDPSAPAPIQKGSIDGNKISLELAGPDVAIRLDGEVSDGTLKLATEYKVKFADRERTVKLKFELKREK